MITGHEVIHRKGVVRLTCLLLMMLLLISLSTISTATGNDTEGSDRFLIDCMFSTMDDRPRWCSVIVDPANANPLSVLQDATIAMDLGVVDTDGSEGWNTSISIGDTIGTLHMWSDDQCKWVPITTVASLSQGDCMAFIENGIQPSLIPISPSSREPWTQFRGDHCGSGLSRSAIQFEPELLWSSHLVSGDIDTTPAVHAGKVFVVAQGSPSSSSHLFAIDEYTGDVLWSRDLGAKGFQLSSPAITDGLVIVGTTDGVLHAFKESDGTSIWSHSLPPSDNGITGSPTIVKDRVPVASYDGALTCLDLHGNLLWSADLGSPSYFSSPSSEGNQVVIGTDDNGLICIDLETGEQLWRHETEGQVRSTSMWHGERIHFTTIEKQSGIPVGGALTVLDGDGDVLWTMDIGPSVSSPVMLGDRIVVGNHQGFLLAFSKDGEPIWSQQLNGPIHSSPSVMDGHLFITTNTNTGDDHSALYILDEDGAILWSEVLSPHDWGLASPVIADGCVFTASDSGHILCWQFGLQVDVISNTLTPLAGEPLQLHAKSIHPKSREMEYRWDFGDAASETGEDVLHTYDEPGEYDVTLSWEGEFGRGASLLHLMVVTEDEVKGVTSNDVPILINESDPKGGAGEARNNQVGNDTSTSFIPLSNVLVLVITLLLPLIIVLTLFFTPRLGSHQEEQGSIQKAPPSSHRSRGVALIFSVLMLIVAAFMTSGFLENPFVGANEDDHDGSEKSVTLTIDFGKSPPALKTPSNSRGGAEQPLDDIECIIENDLWSFDVPCEEEITVLELLEATIDSVGHEVHTISYSYGILVESIAGVDNGDGGRFWNYYLNGVWVPLAASMQEVCPGDIVEWCFI